MSPSRTVKKSDSHDTLPFAERARTSTATISPCTINGPVEGRSLAPALKKFSS